MMRNSKIFPLYVFALTILLFYSCEQSSSRKSEKNQESFELKMSIFSNPQFVDPLYYSNNTEKLVCNLLFQPLLSVNDSSNGITAILASDLPEIDSGPSGDIVHYTLRKDAKWTNGEPVESRDIIFTFKTFLNPHAGLSYIEDYFLFVDSIVAKDKFNFSIYCNTRASDNLFRSGDMEILPEYLFDSARVLSDYSFSELKGYNPNTKTDSVLLNFGEQLQNLRILQSPFKFSGTGAQTLNSFEIN